MFFHQRFVPGLAIYSYMVGDEKTRQCAVIDPTRDVDEYLEIAKREGLRVTHVLETHVHADFVSGSAELKARLGDEVQVVVSGMGGAEFERAARSLRVPILFLLQWDDELIARDAGLGLFDAIGSTDKTLHVNPGGHVQVPVFENDSAESFFVRQLGAGG